MAFLRTCLLIVCIAFCPLTMAAEPADERIGGAALRADVDLLQDAFETLHPGLYRYLTPTTLADALARLHRELDGGASPAAAFLAVARFTAALRCGHTWTNPLNQEAPAIRSLLARADRLPLTFDMVGRRFLVSAAMPGTGVAAGDELVAVDGASAAAIIERLWPLLRADGASDGKRLTQIGHRGGASAFDLFHGLLAPPREGRYTLTLRAGGSGPLREVTLAAVTEAARDAALGAGHVDSPDGGWTLAIDGDTAVLTMPTWAFWNVTFEWQVWLDRAFDTLRERRVANLVIDLRRNEGGDDAIGETLLRRLATTPRTVTRGSAAITTYETVPDRLRPYLRTWDKRFADRTGRVEQLGPRNYRVLGRDPGAATIVPHPQPFAGRAYVLIGPVDSSATFLFARLVKESGVATLVGQPTGGNLRGLNGGEMFFLRLPASGIRIDLPVLAYLPATPQPDAPVLPDVAVPPSLEDAARGIDVDLRAVRRLIAVKPPT